MAYKNNKKENRVSNVPRKGNEKKNTVLVFREGMIISEVAEALGISNGAIMKKLMALGIMSSVNQRIDRDTVELVAMDMGFTVEDEVVTDLTRFDEFEIKDKEEDLVKRPPVVTIMGHVDHGKTTLLDTIRHTRVASGEAGGITQHIGAYQIERNGEPITFIDTPGHAAFTEMRARGAKVTDITVLVVAADDGVMPQTEEAIAHAKAAGCPIIVAINKCDKPTANPDHVMQELSNFDLLPEAWGGSTIYVQISALKGTGVDELLDMIQLTAEMENYRANPNRLAIGSVIEARLDKGRGPIATIIVQNGTLKVGDSIVIGDTYGRVRTMLDDGGRRHQLATPTMAVEIDGLASVPAAGDRFMAMNDEHTVRVIAEKRQSMKRDESNLAKATSLDDLFSNIKDGARELNLIIKGDTQGSIEALKGSLEKINVEDISVNVIASSVGAISDTDVSLANASKAIIIGFNVRPTAAVRETANQKGVEIRLYNIIYKVIEEIEAAMKGMLDPVYEEIVTGQAEVRDTFKISKVGMVAGSFVTDGYIERNCLVRVLRNGVVVYEGKMASLKRFKDDVKEVKQGYECGITIENFNDIKVGDIIEGSIMKEVERK